MAAESLALRGLPVDLFDAMPSVGRKFLLAGRGGLNLTHSEDLGSFTGRYGEQSPRLALALKSFGPHEIREWAHALGIQTFRGTSGRIFPEGMKAAPLLRAWIRKLRELNVRIHTRHRWTGWSAETELLFWTPAGEKRLKPMATIFALGGASWPHLGSDGSWPPLFESLGISTLPLRPSNCGFLRSWSTVFSQQFQGEPLKAVTGWVGDSSDGNERIRGEALITARGIEGGLIYALSGSLRAELEHQGYAMLSLDLAPDRSLQNIEANLHKAPSGESLSTRLRKRAGLSKIKIALIREVCPTYEDLPRIIKALPIRLNGLAPIENAISTAGGIDFSSLDENLMSLRMQGIFFAGEMLDWDAPTGGYLLSACLATGRQAGNAAANWYSGLAITPP